MQYQYFRDGNISKKTRRLRCSLTFVLETGKQKTTEPSSERTSGKVKEFSLDVAPPPANIWTSLLFKTWLSLHKRLFWGNQALATIQWSKFKRRKDGAHRSHCAPLCVVCSSPRCDRGSFPQVYAHRKRRLQHLIAIVDYVHLQATWVLHTATRQRALKIN